MSINQSIAPFNPFAGPDSSAPPSNAGYFGFLPDIPDAEVERLAKAMDTCGVGVLHDVIPLELIDEARRFIASELSTHQNGYFSLQGDRWWQSSPLAAVARSPVLKQAVADLVEHALGKRMQNVNMAASMRVLTGELGLAHSELYHYDSYVVTVLVPLIIPDEPGKPHGDLMLYPNLRRTRLNVFANILEKLIVESAPARWLWSRSRVQRGFAARAVQMQPGNLYFFWGMRSLHANQTCAVESVRSTALFHYGDPHAGSALKRLSQAHHRFKQRRRARAVIGA